MFINIHILYRYHCEPLFIPLLFMGFSPELCSLGAFQLIFALAPYQLHSGFTFISPFSFLLSLCSDLFSPYIHVYIGIRTTTKWKWKNSRIFPSITHSHAQRSNMCMYCNAMSLKCEPQKITKSDANVCLFVCL